MVPQLPLILDDMMSEKVSQILAMHSEVHSLSIRSTEWSEKRIEDVAIIATIAIIAVIENLFSAGQCWRAAFW
jgi:hypothetical protein